MVEAVILYGSKARKDGDTNSDTDLMGICADGKIGKWFDDQGVSFHVYPLPWLLDEAAAGSLFLLHISCEAVAAFDPTGMLQQIKEAFRLKQSYLREIDIGARVAAAVMNLRPAEFTSKMRQRYFWGLRTTVMAAAANQGQPLFASRALERFCGVEGFAAHIQSRQNATLFECQEMGRRVISSIEGTPVGILHANSKSDLRILLNLGGVGTATAGAIIYGV